MSPTIRPLHTRRGSIMVATLLIMVGVGAAFIVVAAYHGFAIRSLAARAMTLETRAAADAITRLMAARARNLATWQLGAVTQAQLDSLQADLAAIPDGLALPPGLALDTARTGYTLTDTTTGEVLPYDGEPDRLVPHQPRGAFDVAPLGGARAATTRWIEIRATVTGRRDATATSVVRLAVSQVAPVQYALYASGALDLCVQAGSGLVVGGSTRVDGSLVSHCAGPAVFVGPIEARDGIVVQSGTTAPTIMWESGRAALASLSVDAMRDDVTSALSATGGWVRVGAGLGGWLVPHRFHDATVAGHGECPDFTGGCGGRAFYSPSATVTATDSTVELICGVAYAATICSDLAPAITYVPFPFTTDTTPGVARPDPTSADEPVSPGRIPDARREHACTGVIRGRSVRPRWCPTTPASGGRPFWQGLFPDPRREPWCTGVIGGRTVRTLRCPTNTWGYRVDVSGWDTVPGGLLSFRRNTATSALNNASGFQEVVLLTNGAELRGPLTIHSELPVYIVGSFNTITPKPAMIDAPLITALPAETMAQLATGAVWDSSLVRRSLVAYSPVRIEAVLRAPAVALAPTYYGGTVEQVPAVLGDWSRVSLTVHGAVESWAQDPATAGGYASAHFAVGTEPTGFTPVQPRVRRILYDARLARGSFTPPGSWLAVNIPAGGVLDGTRTPARQQGAIGGYATTRTTLWPSDAVRLP